MFYFFSHGKILLFNQTREKIQTGDFFKTLAREKIKASDKHWTKEINSNIIKILKQEKKLQ